MTGLNLSKMFSSNLVVDKPVACLLDIRTEECRVSSFSLRVIIFDWFVRIDFIHKDKVRMVLKNG